MEDCAAKNGKRPQEGVERLRAGATQRQATATAAAGAGAAAAAGAQATSWTATAAARGETQAHMLRLWCRGRELQTLQRLLAALLLSAM
eukprot:1137710-Pelagomonas_calceolata.AAC.10